MYLVVQPQLNSIFPVDSIPNKPSEWGWICWRAALETLVSLIWTLPLVSPHTTEERGPGFKNWIGFGTSIY